MLPSSQASHRVQAKRRPPLPKPVNMQEGIAGQNMRLLDLRILSAHSNQSHHNLINSAKEQPKHTEIFARRSIQSKAMSRKPLNIETARLSVKGKLNTLLSVQDKFEELRQALDDKENLLEQLPPQEKCESSRASTSNSQRSLKRAQEQFFSRKNPSTNAQIKLEFELRKKLTSKSWLVYDQQRDIVLLEKGSSVKREMASLTKIMTCLVVLDLCERLDLDCTTFRVLVSRRAASVNGTSAELAVGTQLTIRDLLYGLMLPSGNDAATTLAECFGTLLMLWKECSPDPLPEEIYDPEKLDALREQSKRCVNAFVAEMNRMALKVGMMRTHYSNPHGLSDKNNYSTCWDLAKLCDHATQHRHFMQIVGTKEFSCVCSRTLKAFNWKNTHKLLEEGWLGIKTGVTPAAGPCLTSFYKDSKGKQPTALIIVLLNCSSMDARYTQTKLLFDCSQRVFE